MTDLIGKTITEIKKLISSKELSAREVAVSHIEHAKRNDKDTNAFICLTEELALRQADAVDKNFASGGELPALGGVPITLKDNICVPGYPTTCGSKILENYIPPYQATAANKLFEAGAVCIGKGNLDEFAMGSSNENSAYSKTRNPWNLKKVPGGSSGGPAVAVASGYSTIGFGSDTGGSIRLPASFCGIVGMKPTYGLVSRYGLVAYASSLDQIGPFGLSVEDCALALAVITGNDPKDSTSIRDPFGKFNLKKYPTLDMAFAKSLAAHDGSLKGTKVGVLNDLLGEGLEPEVRAATENSIKVFRDLGAEVDEVKVEHLDIALPVYYIIATAEASANLSRYDGVRYGARDEKAQDLMSMYLSTRQAGFGDEVKRRIMLGTYALSTGYYDAYYKKAQQVRRLIKEAFDKAFEKYDVLICPTSPTVAFGLGEKTDDPLTMYLSDIATIPINLAGLPGISVPCGFGREGLPIGMQMVGPQLSDARLLTIAHAFEKAGDFSTKRSPIIESYCAAK
jgi:aspartyl-tRNA(Asn)/glutamyl-tRNA(Gln) amidotransferase subunit A